MFNKIKAIKDLRDQAKTMKSTFDQIVEEGEGAHGKVRIKMNGNQEIVDLFLDDAIVGDKTRLENGLKEAWKNVVKKIQHKMAAQMKDMGGLDAFKNLGL